MNAVIDISNVTLKTERLILRPWKLTDLDDFYEYASVDGVGQMAGWLPHESKEKSLFILNKFIDGKKTFAIEYNGKVIGSIGIEKYVERGFKEYSNLLGRELGYVLSKDYWGLGIMPEAVKEVIRYLFIDLKLDFLVCGHFIDNNQSRRVQEKCGFVHVKKVKHEGQDGSIRDCWLSILENELSDQKCVFNKNFFNISDEEIELKIIDTYKGNKGALPFYWWDIILKEKNISIGKISYRIGDNYHSYYNGNIGYEIDEKYQGNNYAFKACKLILDVIRYHQMDKIYLTCRSDNVASYKTIEKLGGKLIEEVIPPNDYIYYYEGMTLYKIYELSFELDSLIRHYDSLIDENNDPVLDQLPLKEYMDKYDGDKFIDLLNLSKDKSVLEIGVGTGRIAIKIVDLCKSFTGIDISPKTITRANYHLKDNNVNLICDDFFKYQFTNKYNVIYSSLTFMHFKDKRVVFNKVADLLLSDGIFVFSIDKGLDDYLEYGNRRIKVYPTTKDEIIEQLNQSNLMLIKEDVVEFSWLFVCKKR